MEGPTTFLSHPRSSCGLFLAIPIPLYLSFLIGTPLALQQLAIAGLMNRGSNAPDVRSQKPACSFSCFDAPRVLTFLSADTCGHAPCINPHPCLKAHTIAFAPDCSSHLADSLAVAFGVCCYSLVAPCFAWLLLPCPEAGHCHADCLPPAPYRALGGISASFPYPLHLLFAPVDCRSLMVLPADCFDFTLFCSDSSLQSVGSITQ